MLPNGTGGGGVTGVDLDERNIRVCRILASEHPNFKINFITAKVEEFLPTVKNDEYDLVFCFNVLHWVTPKFGFSFVQNLLIDLAEKIPNGLFELATLKEFPHNNLPNNYREFLQGYSFIRALFYPVWSDTKDVKRPFLFASKDYMHFDNFGLLKIDGKLNGGGFSKSYRCGNFVVKTAYIADQKMFNRAKQEVEFLKEFGGKDGLPRLLFVSQEFDEAGLMVFLIREYIKGITLDEKIKRGEDFDSWKIIEQILRWMILLKKHGLYQSDLHCGNFLYTDDEKVLPLDYELIVRDEFWEFRPRNARLRLFNLMCAILAKEFYFFNNLRCPDGDKGVMNGKFLTEFHKYVSEDKYQRILQLKDDENFFENLYEILFKPPKTATHTIGEIETLANEELLHELLLATDWHMNIINGLAQVIWENRQRIERLEKIIQEKLL